MSSKIKAYYPSQILQYTVKNVSVFYWKLQ